MVRSITFFRTVLAIGAGSWAAALPAQDLGGLLQRSPFGSAVPGPPASAEGPLEFRSVLLDQGEYFFSVFQTATHTALWVGLNEPGNPFTVRSYDEKTETMKVDFQGRSLSLSLKQAKIQAFVQRAPGSPQTMPGQAGGSPNAGPASPADEAGRLARIAEEIRRRRALRQQAVPSSQPPNPKTNANNIP